MAHGDEGYFVPPHYRSTQSLVVVVGGKKFRVSLIVLVNAKVSELIIVPRVPSPRERVIDLAYSQFCPLWPVQCPPLSRVSI